MARCGVCFCHCEIAEGQKGFCGARVCRDGAVRPENYGRITGLALDPIEKKPLRRFHPGGTILSAGSYGCNLRCPFCQNHDISWSAEAARWATRAETVTPEELVDAALRLKPQGNIGLAFTYNEPLIGWEFVRDAAKLAHEAGLLNVLVTNGTAELTVLEALAPYIDAMNIDLKGFTARYYSQVLGGDLEMTKAFIARAAQVCHVELTTLIVPGENDSEDEIRALTAWVAGLTDGSGQLLGPGIPLHISRFFPRFRMTDRPATDVGRVYRLAEIARRIGKNVEIEAANKVSITSGKNISSRYFTDSGLDGNSSKWERFLQASGRSVMDAAYNFTRTTVDHLVSKFYDVTLIRTLIEVFTRPIDGTTSIKSFTFVQVEAGKGSAEYPYEAYRKEQTSEADYTKLENSITTIGTEVGNRIKAINDSYSELCTAIKGFADISGTGDNMLNKDGAVISFDTIMTKGWDNKSSDFKDDDFNLDKIPVKEYNEDEVLEKVKTDTGLTGKPDINKFTRDTRNFYYEDLKKWDDSYKIRSKEAKDEVAKFNANQQTQIKNLAKKLAAAFVTLEKSFEDLALTNNDKIYTNEVQTALNTIFDELKGKDCILKTINDKSLTKDSQEDKTINWDDLTKLYRRKAVFKLVAGACSKVAATDKVKLSATYDGSKDVADDSAWKSLVESWVTEPSAAEPKAILDYGGSLFKDGFTKEWLWDTFASPWVDTTYNRRRWATGSNGKILLSESPDRTISFDPTGASKALKNLILSDKAVETIINSIKSL